MSFQNVILGFVLSSAAITHTALAATPFKLQVACKATLLGSSGEPVALDAKSQVFEPTIGGFGQSGARIAFDYLTINGSVSMSQIDRGLPMQPTFTMMFYKNGNPIQGSINFARVQGLELETREFSKPITVFGANFIQATYNGKSVSRVDYQCSLTKVAR